MLCEKLKSVTHLDTEIQVEIFRCADGRPPSRFDRGRLVRKESFLLIFRVLKRRSMLHFRLKRRKPYLCPRHCLIIVKP